MSLSFFAVPSRGRKIFYSLNVKSGLILFASLAVLLVASGVYLHMKKNYNSTLRVMLFRNHKLPESFDPVKIHFAPEYLFLENIYSPLVEYSTDGELVSGVAESFEWVGTEAHFKIRKNLTTIDGYKITAYDVEKTLKRVLIIGGNTHGNLKDILCQGHQIKSLDDVCPGMEVRDNGGLFVLRFSEKKPFLFPMLTAIDFGIIPAISIDPVTLKIVDYKNTSGPYYVPAADEINLKANPRHYHYSAKIPQSVIYVYSKDKNVFDPVSAFSENRIDHITTVGSTPDVLIPYAQKHKNINLHVTYPFWLRYVAFTQKGRGRFTEEERLKIGNLIRKAVLPRYLKLYGYEDTEHIFPAFGEGGLSKKQALAIKAKDDSFKAPNIIKGRFIAWYFPKEDLAALKKVFPNTEFVDGHGIPGLVDYKKEGILEPDFYFSGTDMSFQEDIGLLSYQLNKDFFCLTGLAAKAWVEKYSSISDKKNRIKMLNQLHYETLLRGVVVPLVFCPYAAILRKPWVFGLSNYSANDPLWRITRP
jgi:hypothetical protein